MTATADPMYVFAEDRVPFAPIPTEPTEMRLRHDDEWTFCDNPISRMGKDAYRDAAHELIYGREDEAQRLAFLGRSLEDAYVTRIGRESRARMA